MRVHQPLDRLPEGDTGRDEDREHDREPGPPLPPCRAEEERNPERHRAVSASPTLWIRSASSATLSVSTKRRAWTAAARREHAEARRDRADTCPRADDDGSTRPCE